MSINLLDIILLIPLLWFGYNGYKKGLIIEVSSLIAFILGLYFAFYFSDFTANLLREYFTIDEKYMAAISFVVTFIGVLFIVLAVGKMLEKIIDILLLGFLNKLGGLVFGVLKGALFLSIIIFGIHYFDSNNTVIKRETAEKSIFYEPIESIAPALYSWLHLEHFKFRLPEKETIINSMIKK